ncbi:MAG: putative beta-lysine N-acetyltransferase [Bacillota bacterium]
MYDRNSQETGYDIGRPSEESFFSGDNFETRVVVGEGFRVRFVADGFNDRLSVLDFEGEVKPMVGAILDAARARRGFGKIFLKTRRDNWESFISLGFVLEGIIKGFFRGEDAYAMARFLDAERRYSPQLEKENRIIEDLLFEIDARRKPETDPRPDGEAREYEAEPAKVEDADGLADLYESVFDTYPTPLNRPEYVAASMQHGAMFKLIRHDGRIVSAASAVVDYENANAEMTDCATLKAFRGRGMMRTLLRSLEQDLARRSIGCLYSIARSTSYGMNLVFHSLGYHYQGRLINHCHIMGQLEDMNLWVKNPLDTGLNTVH